MAPPTRLAPMKNWRRRFSNTHPEPSPRGERHALSQEDAVARKGQKLIKRCVQSLCGSEGLFYFFDNFGNSLVEASPPATMTEAKHHRIFLLNFFSILFNQYKRKLAMKTGSSMADLANPKVKLEHGNWWRPSSRGSRWEERPGHAVEPKPASRLGNLKYEAEQFSENQGQGLRFRVQRPTTPKFQIWLSQCSRKPKNWIQREWDRETGHLLGKFQI